MKYTGKVTTDSIKMQVSFGDRTLDMVAKKQRGYGPTRRDSIHSTA